LKRAVGVTGLSKNKTNIYLRRILILIPLLILMNTVTFGWFKHDYTCIAFPDQCTDDTALSKLSTSLHLLGRLIPEAGVYFFESSRDYKDFLKEMEKSEIYGWNLILLQDMINKSITDMENAYCKYSDILNIAKNLEIDLFILEKLIKFDYAELKYKYSLNPTIFEKAVAFCKTGDVKGIYSYTHETLGILLDRLRQIKAELEQGSIPEIYLVWETGQLYCDSELFGQYISRIFHEIKSR